MKCQPCLGYITRSKISKIRNEYVSLSYKIYYIYFAFVCRFVNLDLL